MKIRSAAGTLANIRDTVPIPHGWKKVNTVGMQPKEKEKEENATHKVTRKRVTPAHKK